jgi:hypothetical protein
MTCSTCNQDRVVTITHTQRIGRRVVTWTVCVGCELAERRAA